MDKHIFICEDNIENILTGIYKAFEYCKHGHSLDSVDIIICENNQYEREFFATYETIITDFDKAFKTMEHIKKKLGSYIHTDVLRVLCHYDSNRAYTLFRFLQYCFKNGISAADDLTNDYVIRIMELSRKVGNESHLFYGFVRFNNINGILYSVIEPKCNVIPLIIEHFTDRFPCENWIIEDKGRKLFAIHKAYGETKLFSGDYNFLEYESNNLTLNDEYEDLWNTFFNSISIKERENKKCQQNLLPLWMRTHMNEFITH